MPVFREKVRLDDVNVIRATEKAILVEVGGEEMWVPQSQIDDDSEVWEERQEGTLIVSEWWAERKGLV